MNGGGFSTPLRQALFPQGFPGEVMTLIAETWQHFSMNRSVRLEERITALFAEALIDAYEHRGWPWTITSEGPITDPEFGTQFGRNDLRFMHNFTVQRCFFTVECKRLHVRTTGGFKHLADSYVEEGMLRFATGKYGAGRSSGGMVGYVMDNDLEVAHRRVREESLARKAQLCIKRGKAWKSPSSVLANHGHSADSVVVRDGKDFVLHHILLGVPS